MNIKIFSDGADPKAMFDSASDPNIQGFTTNPSLMKAAGITDYVGFCKEILAKIPNKPISFEVFADDFGAIEKQALEIASWGENVYVKVPVTNCEGVSTAPLSKKLASQGVKLNVTAVFTLKQVWETCQAIKGGAPSIVSVFAGRIADAGVDPVPLMAAAVELCDSADKNIELLWASSREALNVIQADSVGCHIITMTPSLIKKMKGFGKDLTQFSLETVRMFKTDAEKVGYTL